MKADLAQKAAVGLDVQRTLGAAVQGETDVHALLEGLADRAEHPDKGAQIQRLPLGLLAPLDAPQQGGGVVQGAVQAAGSGLHIPQAGLELVGDGGLFVLDQMGQAALGQLDHIQRALPLAFDGAKRQLFQQGVPGRAGAILIQAGSLVVHFADLLLVTALPTGAAGRS